MSLEFTIIAKDQQTENNWAQLLSEAIGDYYQVKIRLFSKTGELGEIIFIDSSCSDLDQILAELNQVRRAVFLIVSEKDSAPQPLLEGKVDDVLVYPFRSLEVMSKLKYYHQILMWDEVSRLNASFSELIEQLHDDLRLAERIQKNRLPSRFPKIKGVKVSSRYLAGGRSGGDYFDLAESKDGNVFSVVLSDSSSYGLSSALLSVLMSAAMKLNSDALVSSVEMVKKIQEELVTTLGEKDNLSLFYGTVSRKDYRLRYLNLGSSVAFYASPGKEFKQLPHQGQPISKKTGMVTGGREGEIVLEPGGRLVLVSDGFVETTGSDRSVLEVLESFREKDPKDSLNELVYQVKSKLPEDDLPVQDCTAIILDVDSRLLRLAG